VAEVAVAVAEAAAAEVVAVAGRRTHSRQLPGLGGIGGGVEADGGNGGGAAKNTWSAGTL